MPHPTATPTLETELDAVLHGTAFTPITDRAFLRITGPDAARWLNGMVTNSIQSLAPGEGNYNFLLNAQGRIQGDCTVYRDLTAVQDNYLLETSNDQAAGIKNHLDRFIIMDDVELKDEFSDLKGILLFGNALEVVVALKRIGVPPLNAMEIAKAEIKGFVFKRQLALSASTYQYELWVETSKEEGLRAKLLDAGIQQVTAEVGEQLRIVEGIPRYGTDIRNTDLPQETGQTHALNFNKGCYLGQEIVERIHSRGNVHRTFTRFTLTGELPQLPAPLTANAKPAGELTSAARIGDTLHALGYLRREAFTQPLTYPGGTATPNP